MATSTFTLGISLVQTIFFFIVAFMAKFLFIFSNLYNALKAKYLEKSGYLYHKVLLISVGLVGIAAKRALNIAKDPNRKPTTKRTLL